MLPDLPFMSGNRLDVLPGLGPLGVDGHPCTNDPTAVVGCQASRLLLDKREGDGKPPYPRVQCKKSNTKRMMRDEHGRNLDLSRSIVDCYLQ